MRLAVAAALVIVCAQTLGAQSVGPTKGEVADVERILALPAQPHPLWKPVLVKLWERCKAAQAIRASGGKDADVRRRLGDQVVSNALVAESALAGFGAYRVDAPDARSERDDLRGRAAVTYQLVRLLGGMSAARVVEECQRTRWRWVELVRDLDLERPWFGWKQRTMNLFSPMFNLMARAPDRPASVAAPASPVPSPAPSAAPAAEGKGAATGAGVLVGIALVAAVLGWGLKRSRGGAAARAEHEVNRAVGLIATGKATEALPALQRLLPRTGELGNRIQCHIARCLLRANEMELASGALAQVARELLDSRTAYLLARDLEDRLMTREALELYARIYLADAGFQDVKARYEKLKATRASDSGMMTIADVAARLPARYTKPERLGMGGMGLVLRCHDTQANQPVAVKVLSPLLQGDKEMLRRFAREVKVLELLNHPGVIKLIEAQVEPVAYLVMEFFPAPDLRKALADGAMPVERAVDILHQVAEALAYAHGKGVIHRDVKPENILLAREDRVKVVDFGLAFLEGATALTRSDQAPGTLAYMAPEQIDGRPATAASDVYALGLVALEMLTGTPAYSRDELARRLVASPGRLKVEGALGEPLADLVDAMVAREPEARPDSAQVAARLAGMLRRLA